MESGTRLGPYEILEQLGAGGMGEVWLAEDTRLHRKVAVKILPEEYAGNPERLARFEQEARAAAALNHPNIAAVHDVGAEGSTHYIVQEYLEGRSLRDLLRDDPPKLERALTIGAEVAEALAVAHQAGIVHRDIKPDNIFITDVGHTKVVDFGLAKLVEPGASGSSPDATMSPTVIGTMAGAVMGTVGYMAPEQVEAGEIDGRTDIFALGCVLYEMTTGQRPFQGENIHTTLGRIVSQDPEPVRSLRAELPVRLEWIIAKCLAKNPTLRSQTAGDLAVDLRALQVDIEDGGTALLPQGTADTPPPASRLHPLGLAVGALVGAVAAAAALWSVRSSPPVLPAEVTRLSLELEEGRRISSLGFEQLERPAGPAFALSPDGRRIVYSATDGDGEQRLYLRALDQRLAAAIPGTEGAGGPFFSPDGQWVGFFSTSGMSRVSVGGGRVELVSELDGLGGFASWTDDDSILFTYASAAGEQGIFQVAASGGTPARVTTINNDLQERVHLFPQKLPGAGGLLFTVADNLEVPSRYDIVALNLQTGTRTLVIDGGSDARYLPSGHMVFMRDGNLMAVAFDVETLAATSEPVVVINNVMHAERGTNSLLRLGTGQYSVSRSGSLVYATGGIFPERTSSLEFIDADGVRERLAIQGSRLHGARVSPDGTRVAYSRGDPDSQIWVYTIASQTPRQLTFDGANRYPVWSPDGTRIAFQTMDEGEASSLSWMAADGSSGERQLVTPGGTSRLSPASWSSDGLLVYLASRDIMFIDVEGGGGPEVFRQTPFAEQHPDLSPNGKWLAYTSDESGANEVWVAPFPRGEAAYRLTTDGGTSPVWSRDGRRLFYKRRTATGNGIWGVEVTSEAEFSRVGEPRLVHLDDTYYFPIRSYDVGPDGRFVVLAETGEEVANQPVTSLKVVLNWVEELKQRVPTGR